jgi:hypothetical protein
MPGLHARAKRVARWVAVDPEVLTPAGKPLSA